MKLDTGRLMTFDNGRLLMAAGLNVWAVSVLGILIGHHHGEPHFQLFLLTIVFLLVMLGFYSERLYRKIPDKDVKLLEFRVYAAGLIATSITLTYLVAVT